MTFTETVIKQAALASLRDALNTMMLDVARSCRSC
jgi:hypothetical protein